MKTMKVEVPKGIEDAAVKFGLPLEWLVKRILEQQAARIAEASFLMLESKGETL